MASGLRSRSIIPMMQTIFSTQMKHNTNFQRKVIRADQRNNVGQMHPTPVPAIVSLSLLVTQLVVIRRRRQEKLSLLCIFWTQRRRMRKITKQILACVSAYLSLLESMAWINSQNSVHSWRFGRRDQWIQAYGKKSSTNA